MDCKANGFGFNRRRGNYNKVLNKIFQLEVIHFLTSIFDFPLPFISEWSLHTELTCLNLHLWLFTWNLYPSVGSLGYSNLISTMDARIRRCTDNGSCSHHYIESGFTKLQQIRILDRWNFTCSFSVGGRFYATLFPYAINSYCTSSYQSYIII